jgi:hypothetical protein
VLVPLLFLVLVVVACMVRWWWRRRLAALALLRALAPEFKSPKVRLALWRWQCVERVVTGTTAALVFVV